MVAHLVRNEFSNMVSRDGYLNGTLRGDISTRREWIDILMTASYKVWLSRKISGGIHWR